MNYCRVGGSVSLVAGLMLALAHCGLDDVSQVIVSANPPPDAGLHAASHCVPGQTLSCMGVCGQPVAGYQVCAADGRSYAECVCPPPGRLGPEKVDGNVVAIPEPGLERPILPRRPAQPGFGPGSGVIGAACQRDADCGGGLDCLDGASDSLGAGGPSRGYCTRPCASLAECTAVDPASACAVLAGQNVCARLCQSQAPLAGEAKCLDRPELTCASLAALGDEEPSAEPQLGICVPACQSDAGCPGRRCDLRTGLCTDEAPRGTPIGSACDGGAERCSGGVCLGREAQTGTFCSAYCTLGLAGCGFDGSEASIDAACLAPQIPGEGQGDRGVCFELCDEAEDCLQPGAVCVPEPQNGRAGVCLMLPPPAEPEEPPVSLPDAGAPPSETTIGASCEAEADCGGGGAVCLTAAGDPFGAGGGPAGGYCSSLCESDVDCTQAGTLCVSVLDQGFCLRGCDLGTVDDCGGRGTLSCSRLGVSQRGFCRPQCNSDADCGERVCDVDGGLCVDAPASGACASDLDCDDGVCNPTSLVCIEAPAAPVGAACAEDTDCGGAFCLPFDGSAFCSLPCRLGSQIGCEPFGSDAFCLVPVPGRAGLGVCSELCDAPSDCTQPSYVCEPLTEPLPNGRTGTCLPPLPGAP
jgi:hypothetical protein